MTSQPSVPLGVGIAGGALVGLLLGAATGKPTAGVALGVGLGALAAMVFPATRPRHRRLWFLSALVVIVALVVGGLATFGQDGGGTPVAATVRQLAAVPSSYEGERVSTEGVVRVFAAGSADEHFVVEQDAQARVGLRDVPVATLTPLVGTVVAVQGELRFEEGFGIAIKVEQISVAGSASSGAGPATPGVLSR
jgi:hypothetical protein